MSPLEIVLVVLLILLIFGGLGGGSVVPYWGFGYGLGYGALVLGSILIIIVAALIVGRLLARRIWTHQ